MISHFDANSIKWEKKYILASSIERRLGKIHPIQSDYVFICQYRANIPNSVAHIRFPKDTDINPHVYVSDLKNVLQFDSNCELEDVEELDKKKFFFFLSNKSLSRPK